MASRGGARHFSKPMVVPFVLFQTLNKHVSLVSSLGRYETVSRQQATDAKGLVHCLPLLEALLDLSPTGEIHPGPLRQALLKLVQHKPKINTTDFNGMVYCNMRAERVTTVLLHLRRLKSEEELAKVAAKVSGKEYQLLKELAQNLAGKDTEQNSDEEREAASLDKRGQQEEEEAGPLAKRRQLKKEDSAISMDSSGFPKCLQSPQQSNALPLEDSPLTKGAAASSSNALPDEGSFLKRRKGSLVLKRPSWNSKDQDQSLTEALALGKKQTCKKEKKGSKMKRPAAAVSTAAVSTKKQPWKTLKVTYPRNPERAYIQGSHGPPEPIHHIVEVTKKMTPQYREVIGVIHRRLQAEHLTKEQARALREELLS